MTNDVVTRLTTMASRLLKDEAVEVSSNGEGYYTIAGTSPDGRTSNFPPIWISPSASDQQIMDKLSHEFAQNLNPDSADPDDLSIPNLQNEGRQQPH